MRFAKEDVVIGVRVKRWIEVNKIDTRFREFVPVPQPGEIIAKIQTIH